MSLNLKIIQIDTAKNDAGIGGCGKKAQVAADCRVQTDALNFGWALDRLLMGHI